MFKKGTIILDRDGKQKGVCSGNIRPCSLEGCNGVRVSVTWPDGRRSFPCSKGITTNKRGQLQIG